MKSKTLIAIILLVVFTGSISFADTVATWAGALAGDANHPVAGTGSWKNAFWNKGANKGVNIPASPCIASDDIKITKAGTICTLDSDAGNYICKLSLAGGSDKATAPKLEIVNGGRLGIGEFRVGAGGASSAGAIAFVNQTGGTVTLASNLIVGRRGGSGSNPNTGEGYYTISGGTIAYAPENIKGCLYVAGTGEVSGPSEGTFTVVGGAANITFRKLYVGSDGTKTGGSGTLEFKIDSGGVSPIRLSDAESIILDNKGADSIAKLVVSLTAAPPAGDILLVENTSKKAVSGTFDKVNGNPAPEGAAVILNSGGVDYKYILTYKGGAGSNDIVLMRAL
jgi:hypothetical protein